MYGKSGTLMMEPPFVLVFSNQKLPYHMLSADRWNCFEITDKTKPELESINEETI